MIKATEKINAAPGGQSSGLRRFPRIKVHFVINKKLVSVPKNRCGPGWGLRRRFWLYRKIKPHPAGAVLVVKNTQKKRETKENKPKTKEPRPPTICWGSVVGREKEKT